MFGSQNVYVVWTHGLFGQEDLFFSRSGDGGLTFSSPVNISNTPGKSWCPRIQLDTTGSINVLWEEGAAFVDRKVLFTRSTDGGMSFDTPSILSQTGPDSFCSSMATGEGGRVYVTWTNGDILTTFYTFLAVSSTDGAIFAGPFQIRGPCPQIAAEGPNQIGLVWHDAPQPGVIPDIRYVTGVVFIP